MYNPKIYTYQSTVLSYLSILISCIIFSKTTFAQPVLSLTPVIDTGLTSPIQFVNAGDASNRVFIVQQGGTIRAYDASFNFISVFLTVSNVSTVDERGLLSMAFHPDYENNGFFYVYYTNTSNNLELARYQVSSDSNIANPASKVILITIPHPTNTNHNGGELHFGNDGFLYLSTGDGGGAGDVPNNAQNTSVLLGKMLRFNVNTSATAPYYTIPPGNPFGNETLNLGLRNPFRWSFDRQTFDMWIGDVGQDSNEEINYLAAGSNGVNLGWHCYEGNATFNTTGCGPSSNYVFPVYTYPSQDPAAAITGGIVYRGTAYPFLQGYNISADFYSGVFYKTVSNGSGGWNTSTQTLSPTGIADFGETENGEAYAVSLTGNSVHHIIASDPLPETLVEFSGNLNSKGVTLNWKMALEDNIRQFDIEYSMNGTSFTYLGSVSAQNPMGGYTFLHPLTYEGTIFYRLKIADLDGSYKYSDIIRVALSNKIKIIISPSVISDGIMNVNIANPTYTSLELISMNGALMLKENVAGKTGKIKIPVGKLAPGIYSVRLIGKSNTDVQKIIIQ
ncbi:MAG: PQQ-dependent sugar dehydrogenase [Ginsengibacter sp.]